jgi:hypothetical protein
MHLQVKQNKSSVTTLFWHRSRPLVNTKKKTKIKKDKSFSVQLYKSAIFGGHSFRRILTFCLFFGSNSKNLLKQKKKRENTCDVFLSCPNVKIFLMPSLPIRFPTVIQLESPPPFPSTLLYPHTHTLP